MSISQDKFNFRLNFFNQGWFSIIISWEYCSINLGQIKINLKSNLTPNINNCKVTAGPTNKADKLISISCFLPKIFWQWKINRLAFLPSFIQFKVAPFRASVHFTEIIDVNSLQESKTELRLTPLYNQKSHGLILCMKTDIILIICW